MISIAKDSKFADWVKKANSDPEHTDVVDVAEKDSALLQQVNGIVSGIKATAALYPIGDSELADVIVRFKWTYMNAFEKMMKTLKKYGVSRKHPPRIMCQMINVDGKEVPHAIVRLKVRCLN